MPFVSSMRESFGPQARRTSKGITGNTAAELNESAKATFGPLANGTYNISISGTNYSTACLMSSNSPDGGGWTLAYNLMFDETWMRDQRGYPNGNQDSANAYAMNGFWTNSTPGGAVSNTYDLRYSCRAAGAFLTGYTKILIMYHNGAAATTSTGLAWGYYTKASGSTDKSLRNWFNDNNRDYVWSSGGRTNQLRTSWETPWANSLRSYPGGGDLFVDNSDNPAGVGDMVNMGAYNLVFNGSNSTYGFGNSVYGDYRFTTTIAGPYTNANTPYPHTLGGIGCRHNNGGYPATAMAIGIYDYCDGRRNAIYGDGGQAVDVTYSGNTGQTFASGCLNSSPSNYNTAVKGVSIWVK
jgi:hypothetical protein